MPVTSVSPTERLSGLDAGFLYMETPSLHMHTLKLAVLDLPAEGLPTFAEMKAEIGARLPTLEPLRKRVTPLAYDHYHALAPGVVLVKAPGHTPGSQLVYVALANGRRLLFVGDVAWHMDQIRELWYRPRLVTDVFLGEDRDAVMGELRKLRDVGAANPMLQIVVSHDVDQRAELLAQGVLGERFVLP